MSYAKAVSEISPDEESNEQLQSG